MTHPFHHRTLALLVAASLAGCATLQTPAVQAHNDSARAALDAELASIATARAELEAARRQVPPKQGAGGVPDGMLPPGTAYLPTPAAAAKEPHFDLVVTNAPAQQVFLSMVNGTRYSMIVHPDVTGNISVDLKDTTVPEALDVLRDLYGFEFQIRGPRVTVQAGRMQTRIFNVNYLSLQRSGRSDMRILSGSLSSAPAAAGTPGATNGSAPQPGSNVMAQESSRITTTMDSSMWADLASTLKLIVGSSEGRQIVVSPPTGTVAVRAMPHELAQVAHYLKTLNTNVGRQVMLEAKIIDVQLSDSQQEGINWAAFRNGGNSRLSVGQANPGTSLGTSGNLTGNVTNPLTGAAAAAGLTALPGATLAIDPAVSGGLLGLAFQTGNFAALISFLETQGKVQVLSSPRIASINNQKAVLKVGTDDFFVTNISTTTTTSGTSTNTSPTITVQPFFSGIALDVTPQIDDNDMVTLHVHPSVSDVTEKNKQINLGTMGTYNLPLASSNISETDSIVRISGSNIVAIGGLMRREDTSTRSAVPGAADIPLIGRLFKQTGSSTTKRELVILIRPTVIRDDNVWTGFTEADATRLKLSSEFNIPAGR